MPRGLVIGVSSALAHASRCFAAAPFVARPIRRFRADSMDSGCGNPAHEWLPGLKRLHVAQIVGFAQGISPSSPSVWLMSLMTCGAIMGCPPYRGLAGRDSDTSDPLKSASRPGSPHAPAAIGSPALRPASFITLIRRALFWFCTRARPCNPRQWKSPHLGRFVNCVMRTGSCVTMPRVGVAPMIWNSTRRRTAAGQLLPRRVRASCICARRDWRARSGTGCSPSRRVAAPG